MHILKQGFIFLKFYACKLAVASRGRQKGSRFCKHCANVATKMKMAASPLERSICTWRSSSERILDRASRRCRHFKCSFQRCRYPRTDNSRPGYHVSCLSSLNPHILVPFISQLAIYRCAHDPIMFTEMLQN